MMIVLRVVREYAIFTALILVMVGCVPAVDVAPQQGFRINAPLYEDDFSVQGRWNLYDNPDAFLGVVDGAYRGLLTLPNRFIWGIAPGAPIHDNAVIEVDTRLQSTYERGMYGIMCRASAQNDGRGYHFLISADGAYSIRMSDGRALTALIPWQNSPHIQTGIGRNRLRVVCVGNYLAFYVNGQFIADVYDDTWHDGYAGVMLGISGDGGIDVYFDNLAVYDSDE